MSVNFAVLDVTGTVFAMAMVSCIEHVCVARK